MFSFYDPIISTSDINHLQYKWKRDQFYTLPTNIQRHQKTEIINPKIIFLKMIKKTIKCIITAFLSNY